MKQNSRIAIETKLSIVEKALNNPKNWYSGNAIKHYLLENIFCLFEKDRNINFAIDSNRWSTYCHYSNIIGFINLLEKHVVNDKSSVILHPFLPNEFIDIVIAKGAKILYCDIDLESLAFDKSQLKSYFENGEHTINLIIHYSDNGIYVPIEDQVREAAHKAIPSMVYINNSTLTPDLLRLMQVHRLGSFLWNFGDSFADNILDEVLDKPLESRLWTLSWFLETRVSSSLEYHLSASNDFYFPIIQSYYLLLLEKFNTFGLKTYFYKLKHKMARKWKNFDHRLNQKTIEDTYQDITLAAIPDLIFELENAFHNHHQQSSFQKISHLSHAINLKAHKIKDLITKNSILEKKISKILDTNPQYNYLKYFFYTKDKYFWADWSFENKLKIYEQQPLHPIFNERDTPRAYEASKEIVYFDTVDFIN